MIEEGKPNPIHPVPEGFDRLPVLDLNAPNFITKPRLGADCRRTSGGRQDDGLRVAR
jgi:hypothetical protein